MFLAEHNSAPIIGLSPGDVILSLTTYLSHSRGSKNFLRIATMKNSHFLSFWTEWSTGIKFQCEDLIEVLAWLPQCKYHVTRRLIKVIFKWGHCYVFIYFLLWLSMVLSTDKRSIDLHRGLFPMPLASFLDPGWKWQKGFELTKNWLSLL